MVCDYIFNAKEPKKTSSPDE
uniref:Uncharacterized protein n=1 Tax=Anguilla anguilla TaxID=7936 RepID=A0A0E9V7Z4_ANGAN